MVSLRDMSEIDYTVKTGFLCDMDGVIYHGNRLLPGVLEFVQWLRDKDKRFLFLTNASDRSRKELKQKMGRLGIDVEEEHFYTSALATAGFLSTQTPGASAYVVGEAGLINALYDAGITMNDVNPDYVVVGGGSGYDLAKIDKAINFVLAGSRLIGTNPDLNGPGEHGVVAGCGSLVAPIEMAASTKAYFVGKPNPLMMRRGLKRLGCRREETVIIGDRMDTDIVAGVESEIDTVLVLSGVTSRDDLPHFPYRPRVVLDGVGDIPRSCP
ncbi:MAG: HAD family hydrolase [Spirochaetaceae bacterium]|nr:HAD family hydrolase [Spirochaetaceae bacterium]